MSEVHVCVTTVSVAMLAILCCARATLNSSGATLNLLRRQASNSTNFQAGGSPTSANGQQPGQFVQPGQFIDPSFSSSGGSQVSGHTANATSSTGTNTGGSSPFMPSFIDPSKFLSTGQQPSAFTGFSSGSVGSQPGGFPPGTSGSQTGGFPPGSSTSLGTSSSGNPAGSSGANATSGTSGKQSMYPNMFMDPSKFIG